jgi:hypothetical protein
MSNLVISCDGTWNTPEQRSGVIPTPTNVFLLHSAVAETDRQNVRQRKYYHPGVGTGGSEWDKVLGGGTGLGLDRNIMSAYRWLCGQYAPGDRIYVFGFSRGAYTVRSLCGLISYAGLLNFSRLQEADIWSRVERVFQKGYRRKLECRGNWDAEKWEFLSSSTQADGNRIPIHFIGVWDTVGALGIPDDMALLNIIDRLHDYTFHDTDLGPDVTNARHAIALDEMRATFQPTLWTNAAPPRAKEVWFAGVHSDVGGGYAEAGLSNVALAWMIKEATDCGLEFDQGFRSQVEGKADPMGLLHDSLTGPFAFLPARPRSAPCVERTIGQSDGPVHQSVKDRQHTPPITQYPYRKPCPIALNGPVELEVFARKPWNDTGIWLEKDKTYEFKASGEWLDSRIRCGPKGCDDGHIQMGEIAQMAGTVLGKVELVFKRLTGNESVDFRFTRRHEDCPWFCLMGTIANGGGVDAKGYVKPHESFLIGDKCRYKPKAPGYFFAYANDAWNCYGNNRGSVSVTIQEVPKGVA